MCPEVWKQAKDLVMLMTAAFLAGRLYEKVKIAKAAVKKVQEESE